MSRSTRITTLLLALATLSAAASAQNANAAGPDPSYTQSQPAPIERAPLQNRYNGPNQRFNRRSATQTPQITVTRPAAGIVVRATQNSSVRTVSATADRTELTVEHGVANISVHHPASHVQLLVNLPGGQTALLKDGFYTFNADTNTVRVLKGEAAAFPGKADSKPVKVKEDHELAFTGTDLRSVSVDPYEARADLLPVEPGVERRYVDGYPYEYPYYGYGYPYGFYGYPYGYYGHPYYPFTFGFGYYGGFHRGYGGFRGRR